MATHITGSLGLPAELLDELVERPEDHSGDVEEDGEQGELQMENGGGDRKPVVPVAPVQQDGGGCQEEADGVHGHASHQGWWLLIQVGAVDESEGDTGHEDLQPVEQAWQGERIAGELASQGTGPGHRNHPRECSGSNGVVLKGAVRQELDVGDGKDDGGREA